MNKKVFFKGFIILIISILCFSTNLNSFAEEPSKTKAKTPVKSEKTQTKSIKCNKCPCNCLIKPNQTGECGQYKNIDGKLVPEKK